MALVADLSHQVRMAAGAVHHKLALVERAGHRFLHIHVFALVEGEHHNREVGEIGDGYTHGVELLAIFVKQLSEICKDLCVGMFGNCLLALLALGVYIAQGHKLA